MESSFSLRRKGSGAEAEAMTEDTDTLLDLLSCPHSPWHHDEPWSPQAAALQRVAVVEPERLDADFVCSYFRKLRIVDKDVSVIDNFLLKFCNLQELVLSANRICEISADNLPRTLKVLELRANQLCALGRLAISPPPRLQYLGLAANHLGSHRDVTQLTGRQWPELVCLDLSECDFGEQRPLLKALGTLPCLRTLVLEGNPFTLAPSYPGFAVDALPRLSYLDAAWIAPEERHRYRGMARMSHLLVDWASATVRVGRMQGIPDPLLDEDPDAPEFPVVSYSYVISYMFYSHQTTAYQEVVGGGAAKSQDQGQDQGTGQTQTPNKKSEKETVVSNVAEGSQEHSSSTESRHSTSSQPWADCVDFDDALTFVVRDLSGFKKFLHRGFRVFIEQEKILSWPAEASDEAGQGGVDKKGKQAKVKDKRKKAVVELVADPPIATVVASSHVSLQGLLYRHQKVDVLCDFGCLHKDPPKEDTPIMDENIIMDNKAKDESKKKGGGAGGVRAGNKKPPTTKGVPNVLCTMKMSRACYTTVLLLLLLQGTRRGKGSEERDAATPTQAETATVELSVELKKWRHASKVAPLTPANL
ncbi:leucine-rich repeat-containing protein 43-like isoform X2 [Phycodurus eques]|uniref:leucine-rich repeat-containing protein 43-like isoform X2 n=1 Tax=Phycodurus eques TaxID=693459 RepID=UPI002ACDF74B|nr:leucine-rich repeat-containing protein 43-like isoform X2 [Phycodurus eques]